MNNDIANQYIQDDTLFQTVTFSIGEQLYAVNILYIKDIVMSKKIYRIPNSSPLMLGVTNLRGDIIPVYSLLKILNVDTPIYKEPILDAAEDEYFIIFKVNEKLLAIEVENIHKNIRATSKNYNTSAYLEKWDKSTIFIGVLFEEGNNILMLDVPKLLDTVLQKNQD